MADARAVIDPDLGGRVVSLLAGGIDVVVGPVDEQGRQRRPMDWGVYPMVPFAGRVRDARFGFAGSDHVLSRRAGRHAIHGTVDDVAWAIDSVDDANLVMSVDLGREWPFAGTVHHRISLRDDGLRFALELVAGDAMPAQLGWHPWFRRPARIDAAFASWRPRDADGIAGPRTTDDVPRIFDGVDDCFDDPDGPVVVESSGIRLTLTSDCAHWVVYTGAEHGVCAEPQSGPPNGIVDEPLVLDRGGVLHRWFDVSWRE